MLAQRSGERRMALDAQGKAIALTPELVWAVVGRTQGGHVGVVGPHRVIRAVGRRITEDPVVIDLRPLRT